MMKECISENPVLMPKYSSRGTSVKASQGTPIGTPVEAVQWRHSSQGTPDEELQSRQSCPTEMVLSRNATQLLLPPARLPWKRCGSQGIIPYFGAIEPGYISRPLNLLSEPLCSFNHLSVNPPTLGRLFLSGGDRDIALRPHCNSFWGTGQNHRPMASVYFLKRASVKGNGQEP